MPHRLIAESVQSFLPSITKKLLPRTIATYERDLAEHRNNDVRHRKALARYQDVLGEKDKLIDRQNLLNQECNHRLLNNLQMIVELLSLQSRSEANDGAAKCLAVAAKRVGAIARLHQHLHSIDYTQTVEFRHYLKELCRGHSTMSRSELRADQVIEVEGVEASLPTTTGIPLGLIANELITNAIKHGNGRISVTFGPSAGSGYALSVCNEGSILPEGFDPASCAGLGMKLVSALAT